MCNLLIEFYEVINVKFSFTLNLRRILLSVHSRAFVPGNAHGRNILLSLPALLIREIISLFVPTQSGGMEIIMNDLLEIGQIVNTRGLKGEVKIMPWCDDPAVFEELEYVLIDEKKYDIEYVKYHKNFVILKLGGIDDINGAEKYRNKTLYVERDMLGELPEGTYYICDLIGCKVKTVSGDLLGEIDDIIKTGSNDVYSVKNDTGKPILIPVIDEVVKEVNIEEKYVIVELLKGLID